MRVSTSQLQQLMMNSLQRGAVDFSKVSQQMASGKRILKPSDDAMGTVQLMALKKEQANLSQYNANIGNARSHLGSAETYMTSFSDTILQLRDLTLKAGNGSYGLSERQALASEISALKEALIDTANAKGSDGKYLFSGSQVNTAPVSAANSYQGDNLSREVNISAGVQVSTNVDIENVLFTNNNLLDDLDAFILSLNTNTGDIGADVTAMLNSVDISLDANLELITDIGSRINVLDNVLATNDDITLYSKTLQLKLESLDYAQASMELTQAELALQTTQLVYTKVNQINLFGHM